jgi:hypothetical protein
MDIRIKPTHIHLRTVENLRDDAKKAGVAVETAVVDGVSDDNQG